MIQRNVKAGKQSTREPREQSEHTRRQGKLNDVVLVQLGQSDSGLARVLGLASLLQSLGPKDEIYIK